MLPSEEFRGLSEEVSSGVVEEGWSPRFLWLPLSSPFPLACAPSHAAICCTEPRPRGLYQRQESVGAVLLYSGSGSLIKSLFFLNIQLQVLCYCTEQQTNITQLPQP